jgi:hypothetical protein
MQHLIVLMALVGVALTAGGEAGPAALAAGPLVVLVALVRGRSNPWNRGARPRTGDPT